MRRLLITGGTGFLGREVVRRATTWEVAAPSRRTLDLAQPERIAEVVRASNPDAIVHTAAIMAGEDLDVVNAAASRVIAQEADRLQVPLVHVSTDALFAGDRDHPYVESDDPDPVHAYGRSKALAERFVRAADPAASIVRTSLLFRLPDGDPGKHEQVVADAADGGDFSFFTDEFRCPAPVGDVAAALLALADLDRGGAAGVVHAAGADVLSRYGFACLVARMMGIDTGVLRARSVDEVTLGEARPKCGLLSGNRLDALVGMRIRGAREVLARTGPLP